MDYSSAFAISLSGMGVEKMRLETVARNIANMNSAHRSQAGGYQPLRVVSGPATDFAQWMHAAGAPPGVHAEQVVLPNPPRLVHDPSHPLADAGGYVAYPDINPVTEMMQMIEATRAYDANVQAFNAAKQMAMRALKIGGGA